MYSYSNMIKCWDVHCIHNPETIKKYRGWIRKPFWLQERLVSHDIVVKKIEYKNYTAIVGCNIVLDKTMSSQVATTSLHLIKLQTQVALQSWAPTLSQNFNWHIHDW